MVDEYQRLGEALKESHGIVLGQMFGAPCMKINGKAFAVYYKGNMVFKLGKEEVSFQTNKFVGSLNWDPSGKNKPMKDWLVVPSDFKEAWIGLSQSALNYVSSLNQ